MRSVLVLLLAVGVTACARRSSPPPAPDDVASNPLGPIRQGMGRREVPFHFGDHAVDQEWRYRGLGRVILSAGAFYPLAVDEVDEDSGEPGYGRR